jgi:hypothetical protein
MGLFCNPREEPALDLVGGGDPKCSVRLLDSRIRGNDRVGAKRSSAILLEAPRA